MLIATKEIIADINGTIFKENLQKSYHRNHFDLNHLATIICLNLVYLERDWSNLFSLFPAKPFLLTFIENK